MRLLGWFAVVGIAAIVPGRASAQSLDPTAAETPPEAVAETAGAPKPFAFMMSAGGGFASAPVGGAVSPLGVGLGVSVGVMIHQVYVGGTLLHFLGGNDGLGNAESSTTYGGEIGYELRLGARYSLRPAFGFGGASVTQTATIAPPPLSASPPVAPTRPGGYAHGTLGSPDVVTQASGVTTGPSGGGGGTTADTTTSTSTTTVYVEPSLTGFVWFSDHAFAGATASYLYFPSVSYGQGLSTSWGSVSGRLQLGYRF
jgi:hypothetical protein